MVYTDTKWFCDACGKEITEYKGRIIINSNLLNADPDEIIESEGLDFCSDCMKSFNEWKKK